MFDQWVPSDCRPYPDPHRGGCCIDRYSHGRQAVSAAMASNFSVTNSRLVLQMPAASFASSPRRATSRSRASRSSRLGADLDLIAASTLEITAIERSPRTAAFDSHELDRVLAEHLGRFGEMLRGDVVQARQALQKLLVDRIRFTSITLPDGQQTYRVDAGMIGPTRVQ